MASTWGAGVDKTSLRHVAVAVSMRYPPSTAPRSDSTHCKLKLVCSLLPGVHGRKLYRQFPYNIPATLSTIGPRSIGGYNDLAVAFDIVMFIFDDLYHNLAVSKQPMVGGWEIKM